MDKAYVIHIIGQLSDEMLECIGEELLDLFR